MSLLSALSTAFFKRPTLLTMINREAVKIMVIHDTENENAPMDTYTPHELVAKIAQLQAISQDRRSKISKQLEAALNVASLRSHLDKLAANIAQVVSEYKNDADYMAALTPHIKTIVNGYDHDAKYNAQHIPEYVETLRNAINVNVATRNTDVKVPRPQSAKIR